MLLWTTSDSIPESERKLAVRTVAGLSSGQFSIPPEKREYFEAEEEVNFEFLGLAIKEPKNGQRTIQVAGEKLGECLFAILKALEEKDFSESTSRHIQGQANYLKSIHKDGPLPLRIRELHEQYKFLKQLADTAKKGQLLLPIPPFQN